MSSICLEMAFTQRPTQWMPLRQKLKAASQCFMFGTGQSPLIYRCSLSGKENLPLKITIVDFETEKRRYLWDSYLGLFPLTLWFALCLLSILPKLSKAVLIQPPAFVLSKETICQNIKAKVRYHCIEGTNSCPILTSGYVVRCLFNQFHFFCP